MRLDVVYVLDPRFPGGTSSAVASDVRAAARAGMRCGFLPVWGPVLRATRLMEPRLKAALAEAGAIRLTPDSQVDCDVLFAEHPLVFKYLPSAPCAIRPRFVVLVAHHPPILADGTVEYDPNAIIRNLEFLWSAPVVVAPVGPWVRRTLIRAGLDPAKLSPIDLHNMIDEQEWAPPILSLEAGAPVVVGRHSRPDRLKWPDTLEDLQAAYPSRADITVRVLGGAPPKELMPIVPANWEILPFTTTSVAEFLGGLHFYVYFHSKDWVEAFGRAILEAMAAGKVVILDPAFQAIFLDAAVYCRPAEVGGIIDRFRTDPAAYLEQATRARAAATSRYSTSLWADRHKALRVFLRERDGSTDLAQLPRRVQQPPRRQRRVLFMSSNGIGLGHLTRLAAIASRLPDGIAAAFFTLSQGARFISEMGFPLDFVPSHHFRGLDNNAWNRALAQELALALELFQPDVIVFDGNMPYSGLTSVLDVRPDIRRFWIRRALWKREHSNAAIKRADKFDAVIEPGELASAEDMGATVQHRGNTFAVPPILLTDPDTRPSREEALARLGLRPDRPVVALQLGAIDKYDAYGLQTEILNWLLENSDTQIIEIASPLSIDGEGSRANPRISKVNLYPIFPHSRAFDLMITNAGYNTFHENVMGGVPTIFVPNEAPGGDDQLLRACFAEVSGLGLTLRAPDRSKVPVVMQRAVGQDFRQEVARRAKRLDKSNGAAVVAELLTDAASSLHASGRFVETLVRI